MPAYPYTIDNGHGERLTFTGVTPDGNRLEAEGLAEPGAGAPMHVHHLREEAVRIVSGRMGHQSPGEPEQFAGPVPAFVRRVVMPVVFAAGTVLGRYAKYRDAPPPVRRR